MSKDRFSIPLKCPSCGASGTAQAEEADGYRYMRGHTGTTITELPGGFKIVPQRSSMASVDIYCDKCDVSAITRR